MNFLAHALLSAPQEDKGVLVGNVTADFIKGRVRQSLPESLRRGITLHRKIDAYTDVHPQVWRCAEVLNDRWGRYSPVLVDVFFDHFLARQWRLYCPVPLEPFVASVYEALRQWHAVLPPRAMTATGFMMQQDWLGSYVSLEGIELALWRMSQRLRHGVDLSQAVHDLRRHETILAQSFEKFFAEMLGYLKAE